MCQTPEESTREAQLTSPTYQAASRELLTQAREELSGGAIRQASEKGWEAAAQIVKAVAESRGWQHDGHGLLHQVVRRLVQETDDQQLIDLFQIAGYLHTNFYENWQPPEFVESALSRVEQFIAKLEPLL